MKKIIIILLIFPSLSFGSMDKDRCGASVVAALKTLNINITGASEANLLTFWKVICDEIIKEITVNMEITTTVTVPGVTVGPTTVFGTGVDASVQ